MDSSFLPLLARRAPVRLDGGLATSLEERGHQLTDALWSARLLLDAPDELVAVHGAFLAAGADVVSTASYQLAARSLAAAGRDPGLEAPLLTRSVELARQAVTDHAEPAPQPATDHLDVAGMDVADAGGPCVAASVGPYGAVLGGGAEYRGRYGCTVDDLVAFHAPRVEALVAAGPDVLACETLPSGDEVAALAQVLRGTGIPAWVSVTPGADGRTTPEGQPLADALAPIRDVDEVVAVGVNCCPPERVAPALDALAVLEQPLLTYPNLGARWDAAHGWWRADGDREVIARAVPTWLERGVRLLGGCCGTSPDDVRWLGGLLARAGQS